MRRPHVAELDALGLGGIEVAEPSGDGALRLDFSHAARDVVLDAHFRMKAQLVVDVGTDVRAPKREIAPPGGSLRHVALGLDASSAANTAPANRVQVARSTFSC